MARVAALSSVAANRGEGPAVGLNKFSLFQALEYRISSKILAISQGLNVLQTKCETLVVNTVAKITQLINEHNELL